MKNLIKILILFFLLSSCFAERILKAKEQGQYSTDPSKVFNVSELEPFYNATVKLNFVYDVESSAIVEAHQRAVSCMGLLVAPNHLYTAAHCVFNTNVINNSQTLKLQIVDPNTKSSYAIIPFEEVHTKMAITLKGETDFLGLAEIAIMQHDMVILTLPTGSIPSSKYISNPQKITKAMNLAELLACRSESVAENILRLDIKAKCRTDPTLVVAFASPQKGGWFTKTQNSKHMYKYEPANFPNLSENGYSFSYGLLDQLNFPKHLYKDMKANLADRDSMPLIPATFGVFHNINVTDLPLFSYNYNYSYVGSGQKQATKSTFSHIDIDYNTKAMEGDSGGAVVACDRAGVLGAKNKCYFIGTIQGGVRDDGAFKNSGSPAEVDIGVNFVDAF